MSFYLPGWRDSEGDEFCSLKDDECSSGQALSGRSDKYNPCNHCRFSYMIIVIQLAAN